MDTSNFTQEDSDIIYLDSDNNSSSVSSSASVHEKSPSPLHVKESHEVVREADSTNSKKSYWEDLVDNFLAKISPNQNMNRNVHLQSKDAGRSRFRSSSRQQYKHRNSSNDDRRRRRSSSRTRHHRNVISSHRSCQKSDHISRKPRRNHEYERREKHHIGYGRHRSRSRSCERRNSSSSDCDLVESREAMMIEYDRRKIGHGKGGTSKTSKAYSSNCRDLQHPNSNKPKLVDAETQTPPCTVTYIDRNHCQSSSEIKSIVRKDTPVKSNSKIAKKESETEKKPSEIVDLRDEKQDFNTQKHEDISSTTPNNSDLKENSENDDHLEVVIIKIIFKPSNDITLEKYQDFLQYLEDSFGFCPKIKACFKANHLFLWVTKVVAAWIKYFFFTFTYFPEYLVMEKLKICDPTFDFKETIVIPEKPDNNLCTTLTHSQVLMLVISSLEEIDFKAVLKEIRKYISTNEIFNNILVDKNMLFMEKSIKIIAYTSVREAIKLKRLVDTLNEPKLKMKILENYVKLKIVDQTFDTVPEDLYLKFLKGHFAAFDVNEWFIAKYEDLSFYIYVPNKDVESAIEKSKFINLEYAGHIL